MADSQGNLKQLAATSKLLVRRLMTIGQNRLELLTIEVQEERERLLHALLMALGVAVFGLLACMTLTAAIVVWLWKYSPEGVLLAVTGVYAIGGIYLCRRLMTLMRDWHTLSASLDQLRKDRAHLEKLFS